jgi:hypothetical protein
MALEDTAAQLISKFGRTSSLLKKSLVPADPLKPWEGSASEGSAQSIEAVFLDFDSNQIDGTVIKAGDQKVLVAAKPTAAISTEDSISDGGKTWRIVSANLLAPGTVAYLWTLQVRT